MTRRVTPAVVAGALLARMACAAASPGPGLEEPLRWSRTYTFGESTGALLALEAQWREAGTDPARLTAFVTAVANDLAGPPRVLRPQDAGPGASVDRQRFLCDLLARTGSPAAVPALSRLLADPHVGSAALQALEAVPGPEAGAALRTELGRATGPGRIAVIAGLGRQGDPASAAPLKRLLTDRKPAVVEAAAWALIGIEGGAAAASLTRLEGRREPGLQEALTAARLKAAEEAIRQHHPEAAEGIYTRLFAEHRAVRERIAGLRGLAIMRREKAIPLLLTVLSGSEAILRGTAARSLELIPGEAATLEMAGAMAALPAPAVVALLDVLARREGPVALEAVIQATDHVDPEVRVAALRALATVGDERRALAGVRSSREPGVPVLVLTRAAATRSGREREAARASLALLPGAGVDTTLGAALAGAEPGLKAEIVRGLAGRRAALAAPTARAEFWDPDHAVRAAARESLTSLGEDRDVPMLLEALAKTDDDGERGDIAAALSAIAERSADRAALAQLIRSRLKAAGGATAAALLRVLAEWPDASVAGVLLTLATPAGKADPAQRIIALRGYLRLAGREGTGSDGVRLGMYDRALAVADRPEERRQILGGLADLAAPEALDRVWPLLPPDQLPEEAAAAAIRIAGRLRMTDPDLALEAVRRALPSARGEEILSVARETTTYIESHGDFIGRWRCSPAYTREGASATALFDVVFPPETQPDRVAWTRVATRGDGDRPFAVDLGGRLEGEERVAYLTTRIRAVTACRVRLELGSDDGIKAWVNGVLVHSANELRSLKDPWDQATVSLNRGWNVLLLKITQAGGDWEACARFRTPEGARLPSGTLEVERP